jgi:hypothetical protein
MTEGDPSVHLAEGAMSREGEKIPIPSRVGSNQWSDSACRNLQKRSKKFHRHCEEKGVREEREREEKLASYLL